MSENLPEKSAQDPTELLRTRLMNLVQPLQNMSDEVAQNADMPGGFTSREDISKAVVPRAGRLLVWPFLGSRRQAGEAQVATQSPYRVCDLAAYSINGLRVERSVRFTRDGQKAHEATETRLNVVDTRDGSANHQQVMPNVLPFLTLSVTNDKEGSKVTVRWDASQHSALQEFAAMTGNDVLVVTAASMKRQIDPVEQQYSDQMHLKGNQMKNRRDVASIAIQPNQLKMDMEVVTTFNDYTFECAPQDPAHEKDHGLRTATGGVELSYSSAESAFVLGTNTSRGFKKGCDGQWQVNEENAVALTSQLLDTFSQESWEQ